MATKALIAWVLAAMTQAQPPAKTPWADTYATTAEALATVAEEEPLFDGKDGARRTASWFVSVAWFESTFKPDAVGDKGQSVCLFQIGVSNLKGLGVTKNELLTDVAACTRAARRMMKASIGVCSKRPLEDWLGQYAAGGDSCGGPEGQGLRESRHRVRKAIWLFSNIPFADSRPTSGS